MRNKEAMELLQAFSGVWMFANVVGEGSCRFTFSTACQFLFESFSHESEESDGQGRQR